MEGTKHNAADINNFMAQLAEKVHGKGGEELRIPMVVQKRSSPAILTPLKQLLYDYVVASDKELAKMYQVREILFELEEGVPYVRIKGARKSNNPAVGDFMILESDNVPSPSNDKRFAMVVTAVGNGYLRGIWVRSLRDVLFGKYTDANLFSEDKENNVSLVYENVFASSVASKSMHLIGSDAGYSIYDARDQMDNKKPSIFVNTIKNGEEDVVVIDYHSSKETVFPPAPTPNDLVVIRDIAGGANDRLPGNVYIITGEIIDNVPSGIKRYSVAKLRQSLALNEVFNSWHETIIREAMLTQNDSLLRVGEERAKEVEANTKADEEQSADTPAETEVVDADTTSKDKK